MQSQGPAVLIPQNKGPLNEREVGHLTEAKDYTSNNKLRNNI